MGLTSKPSRKVVKDRRWPAFRQRALRRYGWRCVQCDSRVRLEVDHILPVRDRPDLAFDLDNLQVLCWWCHIEKTRAELGLAPMSAERRKWLKSLRFGAPWNT